MKPLEIQAERIRRGYSREFMAEQLGISKNSYRLKERGRAKFDDSQKVIMATVLGLSLSQVNDIFFDGKLPE